ncbi:MAG: hypothetical protein ACFCU1_07915 [Sumerlaeia bacterium]
MTTKRTKSTGQKSVNSIQPPLRHQTKGEYLAQILGKKPVNMDQLTNHSKGRWPEEYDFDEFLNSIREMRKQRSLSY